MVKEFDKLKGKIFVFVMILLVAFVLISQNNVPSKNSARVISVAGQEFVGVNYDPASTSGYPNLGAIHRHMEETSEEIQLIIDENGVAFFYNTVTEDASLFEGIGLYQGDFGLPPLKIHIDSLAQKVGFTGNTLPVRLEGVNAFGSATINSFSDPITSEKTATLEIEVTGDATPGEYTLALIIEDDKGSVIASIPFIAEVQVREIIEESGDSGALETLIGFIFLILLVAGIYYAIRFVVRKIKKIIKKK